MKESVLMERSMAFAVAIVSLVRELRQNHEYIIAQQIGRSGTSIGANLREAQYAQSKADFNSKLQIALKEANETCYWLELLNKTDCISAACYDKLISQCNELIRMLIASVKTAKRSDRYA